MSTRATIVYEGPIHIYEEVLSQEICISLETDLNQNEKYGDPTITKEQLKKIANDIFDWIVKYE